VVQAPDRQSLMPSERVLALHDLRQMYADFSAFQPQLALLLRPGGRLVATFLEVRMHHIASWKHGVLGSDLPGVLVIEAQR